ncbi:hypothetical protein [Salisaeta longa]|uniref:hypothetical protein n=1 Tax=Salisaeta longa TaxID=503170 RepID=UPI0003B5E43F|nr:hypothetical protein [Salisaeta longa]
MANVPNQPATKRPRNITDVLCNSLGAPHPDGALHQIHLMRRALRNNHRMQRQLRTCGFADPLEAAAAVQGSEALRRRAQRAVVAQRAAVDEALEAVAAAHDRLQEAATSAAAHAPPTEPTTVATTTSDAALIAELSDAIADLAATAPASDDAAQLLVQEVRQRLQTLRDAAAASE